jgi:hypothetical protein
MPDNPETAHKKTESNAQTQSPSGQSLLKTPEVDEKTPKAKERKHRTNSEINIANPRAWVGLIREWAPIALNLLIFLAIAFQAVIFTEQSGWMKRQSEEAQAQTKALNDSIMASIETRELEMRAYVNIRAFGLAREPDDPTPKDQPGSLRLNKLPIVAVSVVNAGRTPAINTVYRTALRFRGNAMTADPLTFDSSDAKPGLSVVGPGLESTTYAPANAGVDAQTLPMIAAGLLHLYAYGRIEYDDKFGHHHVTEFCTEFNPLLGVFLWSPVHNSAD